MQTLQMTTHSNEKMKIVRNMQYKIFFNEIIVFVISS